MSFVKNDKDVKGHKTHFAILGQVDLQGFRIIFESQRSHGKQDIFSIHRLPLLLLTFLGSCVTVVRKAVDRAMDWENSPSLVMNEMNSLTHSCMHSFASLAILALSGNAVFMIRATGAKLRMLASETE
jgi:hypothetical protein